MKTRLRKLMCIVSSATLLLAFTAGCSKIADSSSSNAETSSASIDISKAVQLQFYMLGDAPKDLSAVSAKINELAKKDLNCTVKFNFTTWTDYSQKYSMLLSSGESIDLLYTAPWAGYGSYAQKGAFMSLNSLLPKYAPDLYKHVSEKDWDLCKLNGNIYTIPSTYKEYFSSGLIYREDLRKKYNLPVPDTFKNCEAYMLGIKKNMPSQMVTDDEGSNYLNFKDQDADCGSYGMQFDYYNPSEVSQYWGTEKFISDMKDIKRWADEGLWSKSILSDKVDTTSDFDNGKIVITASGINPQKYITAKIAVKQSHSDWEIGYVPGPTDVDYAAYTNHPLNNGYAIPVTSNNPERALMFYQKMVMDETYNHLTEYGIEGTDYKVENGIYQQIGDGFGYEGMNGWSWRNPDFMLKTSSTDELQSVFSTLSKVIAKHPEKYSAKIMDGFSEDTSSYENEAAALDSVMTQYLNPLLYGEVSDVDKATTTFMEKAKAAGLEKVQQGWEEQWIAYCKQQNY